MAAQHCSVQEAMDWVGRFHDELVDFFLAEYKSFPEFPQESEAVNEHVREYANALANWVRASDCWGFEVSLIQSSPASRSSWEYCSAAIEIKQESCSSANPPDTLTE
jgi:hypothetical protein